MIKKRFFLNTYIPLTDQKFETLNLFEIDNQNINVSAIKLGHNDNDIYIRLYNRTDSEQITTLKTNFKNYSLYETNLIEENPVEINNKLIFSKFEIKTVKIILEK